MSAILKIVLAFCVLSAVSESKATQEYTPVVIWHGMGDTAQGRRSLGVVIKLIAQELPGVYLKSLQFGEDESEDRLNSFFMNANTQVETACEMIRNDTKLNNNRFNAIGFSQGGQFLRALVQRCGAARVKNLITLGSQHQGVYGLPKCPGTNALCDIVRRGASWLAYHSLVQPRLVQAQYWKDPRDNDSYLKYNTFLADLNNEGATKNQTYVKNLATLDKFVMVRFNLDTMVQPAESSWFGFYTPGQATEIQPLNETSLYKEDWLGLQALNRRGALDFYQLDADHIRVNITWFKNVIINSYLK